MIPLFVAYAYVGKVIADGLQIVQTPNIMGLSTELVTAYCVSSLISVTDRLPRKNTLILF